MTTAPEKAAPIPADVLALAEDAIRRRYASSPYDVLRFDYALKLVDTVARAILADREARPSLPDSREERIRAEAAEDELDRLYEEFTSAFTEEVYQIRGAAMWAGEVLRRKGAMFPADRARARQGGNNG